MDIQESLKLLGLSERESRVYHLLLSIGPTTTTRIVSSSGIPSSKIYDVLERLEQKGMVAHIFVRGKKEFHAANPKKLFDLIKEKEALIEEILPSLDVLFKKTSEDVQAEIYKGKEGMKSIFEDILKEGKDWENMGASGKGQLLLPYYLPHFYEKMYKKRMNLRILSVDTALTKEQFIGLKKKYSNIHVKYLPKSIHNFMSTFIYGNKIVIIPITPTIESLPLAILIKSKESADSYRELFELLWSKV